MPPTGPKSDAKRLLTTLLAVALACLMANYKQRFEHFPGDAISFDADTQTRLAFLGWDLVHRGSIRADVPFPLLGAPFGASLHWTLPFDTFLTTLALPFRAFMAWPAALMHGAWLCQPALFLVLAAAGLHVAASFRRPGAGPLVALLLVMAPATQLYDETFEANHHVFAMALSLLALSSMLRLTRGGSTWRGVAAAWWVMLAIWESMEALPVLLVCLGCSVLIGALRQAPGARRVLRGFAIGLTVLPLAALACDPSSVGFLDAAADRLSVLHVAMCLVTALVVWCLVVQRGGRNLLRLGVGCVGWSSLMAPLLAWWAWRAQLLFSDTFVTQNYWNNISELGRADSGQLGLACLWIPAGAALPIALVTTWRRRRRLQGLAWLAYTAVLLAMLELGSQHVRTTCYGTLLAAPLVGLWLHRICERLTLGRAQALYLSTVALLCPLTAVSDLAFWSTAGSAHPACQLDLESAAALQRLLPKGGTVLSDGSIGTGILNRTHLGVYGAPYHRDISGLHDAVAGLYSSQRLEAERGILRRRTNVIAFCHAASAPTGSVAHDLSGGTRPAWLRRLHVGGENLAGFYVVDLAGLRADIERLEVTRPKKLPSSPRGIQRLAAGNESPMR